MTANPFQEVLSILREHQASQIAMNRSLIEALPSEVKAQIPDDALMFIEHGLAFAYADAIQYCRNLVEAEKERQAVPQFIGASEMIPVVEHIDGNPNNNTLSNLRMKWVFRKEG